MEQLIYVIGDIHGRIDLLEELWVRIDRDISSEPPSEVLEIYLGDYVDRGSASAKVVGRLVKRPKDESAFSCGATTKKSLRTSSAAKRRSMNGARSAGLRR